MCENAPFPSEASVLGCLTVSAGLLLLLLTCLAGPTKNIVLQLPRAAGQAQGRVTSQ